MKNLHSAAAPTEIGEAGMEVDGPILVTGAAGRVGGVGGAVVEMLRQRNLPVRRWSDAKMNVPTRCEPSVPRSLSATSPGPGMSPVLWRVANACTSA